jgi:hypothetical protein
VVGSGRLETGHELHPANRNRAGPLTYDQFRYAFANAVSEDEAKRLYETYSVPTAGKPLFQAATANLNPWTEAKVDTDNPERGPLLIIEGEKDNTVPPAVANASCKQQQDNPGLTEIIEIKNVNMPSPSTAAGAKSPTPPSPSSNDSHNRPGADPSRCSDKRPRR